MNNATITQHKKIYSGRLFTALIAVIMFVLAFGVVQKYIWGDTFLMEYHADSADTLLWANADLENGKPFKPSFDYAYKLLFGGQWLFMPFVKSFGVSIKAQRCAMCLFSFLFTLVLIFFFRSMDYSYKDAFMLTAVMLTAVCITKKTREIYFSHIIHYSLSVFYLLLAFSFLQLILKKEKINDRFFPGILFTVCLVMCGMNGSVNFLYVTFPMLAACLIEFYFNKKKEMLFISALTAFSAIPGSLLTLSGKISTSYSGFYSSLAPYADWSKQISEFPTLWITLFTDYSNQGLQVISPGSILGILSILFGIFTFIGFILSFSNYKEETDPGRRIFIFATWIMFSGIFFFMVFGRISDANWRLSPVVFSVQIIIIFQLSGGFGHHPDEDHNSGGIRHGLLILCGSFLILQTFAVMFTSAFRKYDPKIWFDEEGLIETLKAHDLNYGYSTSYWFGNSVTLLTDSKIQSRTVEWNSGRPRLPQYNINCDLEWYDDQAGQEKYFLILDDEQFSLGSDFIDGAFEVYSCSQKDARNLSRKYLHILVYDYNFMKSEYDRLKGSW